MPYFIIRRNKITEFSFQVYRLKSQKIQFNGLKLLNLYRPEKKINIIAKSKIIQQKATFNKISSILILKLKLKTFSNGLVLHQIKDKVISKIQRTLK